MSANRAARGDTAASAASAVSSVEPFKQPIALDSIPRSTRLADSPIVNRI